MVEGLECSQTPLHVACLLGYSTIVQYLIETAKSNPNVKGRKSYNSLWFSVLGKQCDITQYLLLNTNVEFDQLSSDNSRIEDLIDKIEPSYLEAYRKLISAVQYQREQKLIDEMKENISANINPEDER